MPGDTQSIVRLRTAAVGDAPLLAELGGRLFEQTFGESNTADDMRRYLDENFTPSCQSAELAEPKRLVWIAEDGAGKAVGYAVLLRDSSTAGVDTTRAAEVQRIYVDRALHGQKVGDRLMTACVEQARTWGCDVLWLAVWERNPRAIAFYEKTGFRTVGKKTFQLGSDLQHDFVMAQNL